jgi:TRAP-type C4-dicarboxylate transport system permease small subunit
VRRLLDGLYRVSAGLAALGIVVIVASVVAQVGGRMLGVLVPGADDIAGYALTASSFLALAYTLRTGNHIRLTLIVNVARPRARRGLETACLALGALLAGYFSVYIGEMVWDAWRFGDKAQGVLAIPLWIPQSVMGLGATVLCIAFLDDLVAVLRGTPPSYELLPSDTSTTPITRDA